MLGAWSDQFRYYLVVPISFHLVSNHFSVTSSCVLFFKSKHYFLQQYFHYLIKKTGYCSVFSVQCSVFSVQCSVFSVQCSLLLSCLVHYCLELHSRNISCWKVLSVIPPDLRSHHLLLTHRLQVKQIFETIAGHQIWQSPGSSV